MAERNGLDGNTGLNGASSSSGSRASQTVADTNAGQQDSDKTKQSESTNTVPFYKLFSFADSTDKVLMIIGTIAAIGNGLSLPIMTILFGELTDSFGQNQNNKDVLRVVSRVRRDFTF